MPLAHDEVIQSFNITREKRASAYNMPGAHYHNHYEIYYLAKGSVRYFIEDRIYDLEEGDAVLIPPRIIHKTATLKNSSAERVMIAFTNEFIMRSPSDKIFGCFESVFFKKPPISDLVQKAEEEARRRDVWSEELTADFIREILICLTRLSGDVYEKEHINRTAVSRAVKYISESFSSELSLGELSQKFALSPSHFSRQFKAFTGFGVSEYITLVRIKNAEALLMTTNCSITEIAAKCGFNSSSYFTAVFRRVRGVTPMEIKQRGRR